MVGQLLQEENTVSISDLLTKIHKLEVFVKKAERRISSHEKKLSRLKKDLQSEIKNLKKRMMA